MRSWRAQEDRDRHPSVSVATRRFRFLHPFQQIGRAMNIDKTTYTAQQTVNDAIRILRDAADAVERLHEVEQATGLTLTSPGLDELKAWPEIVRAAGLELAF